MEAMKCPNCGAGISKDSGQFCSFCGAKLPDNIHRSEIRIENVAELERLRYEREQNERREAQEKINRKKKIRNKLITMAVQAAVPVAIYFAIKKWVEPVSIVFLVYGYVLAGGIAFAVLMGWLADLLKK